MVLPISSSVDSPVGRRSVCASNAVVMDPAANRTTASGEHRRRMFGNDWLIVPPNGIRPTAESGNYRGSLINNPKIRAVFCVTFLQLSTVQIKGALQC